MFHRSDAETKCQRVECSDFQTGLNACFLNIWRPQRPERQVIDFNLDVLGHGCCQAICLCWGRMSAGS